MMEIAQMSETDDDMFHAGVSIADYTDELQSIFAELGGGRPVVLVK